MGGLRSVLVSDYVIQWMIHIVSHGCCFCTKILLKLLWECIELNHSLQRMISIDVLLYSQCIFLSYVVVSRTPHGHIKMDRTQNRREPAPMLNNTCSPSGQLLQHTSCSGCWPVATPRAFAVRETLTTRKTVREALTTIETVIEGLTTRKT